MPNDPNPPAHKQSNIFDSGPALQQIRYFEYLDSVGKLDDAGKAALERMKSGGEKPTELDPLQNH